MNWVLVGSILLQLYVLLGIYFAHRVDSRMLKPNGMSKAKRLEYSLIIILSWMIVLIMLFFEERKKLKGE